MIKTLSFYDDFLVKHIAASNDDTILNACGIVRKKKDSNDYFYFTSKALYIAYREKIITKEYIRNFFNGLSDGSRFCRRNLYPRELEFLYDPEYNVKLINEEIVVYHTIYNNRHPITRDELNLFGGLDALLISPGVLSRKVEPMSGNRAFNVNIYSIAVHTSFRYTYHEFCTIMRFIYDLSRNRESRDSNILSMRNSVRNYFKREYCYY